MGTPWTIASDEQVPVRQAYGDTSQLAFGFGSAERQTYRHIGKGGRGPNPTQGPVMKLSWDMLFPWAKEIKQAQIKAAEAQAERYSKLFELDDMVKKSLVLLRTGRSDEPPTS